MGVVSMLYVCMCVCAVCGVCVYVCACVCVHACAYMCALFVGGNNVGLGTDEGVVVKEEEMEEMEEMHNEVPPVLKGATPHAAGEGGVEGEGGAKEEEHNADEVAVGVWEARADEVKGTDVLYVHMYMVNNKYINTKNKDTISSLDLVTNHPQ